VGRWRWNLLIPQMLDPVARWYRELAQVTTSGRVPRGMSWTPPLREMINPAEEIKWLREAVQAGFMTLSEVQRSFGYVPSDLLDELAEDLKQARDRGLALSVDGQMDVGRMQARHFDGNPATNNLSANLNEPGDAAPAPDGEPPSAS